VSSLEDDGKFLQHDQRSDDGDGGRGREGVATVLSFIHLINAFFDEVYGFSRNKVISTLFPLIGNVNPSKVGFLSRILKIS